MNTTTSTVLIGIVCFIAGLIIGMILDNTDVDDVAKRTTENVSQTANEISDAIGSSVANNGAVSGAGGGNDDSGVAFTIDVSTLPEGQRTALRVAGVSDDKLVVTNATLACAEAKLGAQRMNEIRNGAAPSMSEGIELVACYR